ncbi:MAG TPA: hypothetical protein VIL04_10470 [Solirubrobacterales bacterium]
MAALAITSGEAILIVSLIAVPVAAVSFAVGARNALRQVGRGPLSIDQDPPARPDPSGPEGQRVREAELRQLLEGKAYRQARRGEPVLDVEVELERLLADGADPPRPQADDALRAEVRSLVIARNERRVRMGKEPLDVDAEVERQLDELL